MTHCTSRRRARTITVALAAVLGAFPIASTAQSPLRVIRRTPGDSATPGEQITVMFDRPVAGSLDRSVDPGRVMRLDPPIAGTVAWRDPVTLRFIPREPLAPGTTLTVTVDTGFRAVDGSRLSEPYRFTAHVPGPTPLAHRADFAAGGVGPRFKLTILYSAAVDLDSVTRLSRVEFENRCPVRSAPVIATRIRPLAPDDRFDGIGGPDRDTTADRFRRVVELTTPTQLPPQCGGFWHVPSFDPARPGDTWKYNVSTPWLLTLERPQCYPGPLCEPGPPRVAFSTSVSADEIRRHVRFTVIRSPGDSTDCVICPAPQAFDSSTRLAAGTVYRISVDTALRDMYSQRLTGSRERVDTVGNFYARAWTTGGWATVPRTARSVTVRYVNADTLTLIAVPIPDSLSSRLLGASPAERYPFFQDTLRHAMRDTLRVDIAGTAARDSLATITIPLPPEVGSRGGAQLYSIRVQVKVPRTVSPQLERDPTAQPRTRIRAPDVFGGGAGWDHPLGRLLQVSDFAVHAKISGDSGAAFVTSLASGGPVAGVAVTLHDADHRALARGVTDADGLARLTATGVPPAVRSPITRDFLREATRYLTAVNGTDRSVLTVESSYVEQLIARPDNWRWPAFVYGAIVTDRDIHRPGEMLHAKLIVRTGPLGDLRTPAGDSIRWRLSGGAQGAIDTVWSKAARLSDFGTTADSIVLPPGIKLGGYSIAADLLTKAGWVSVARSRIRVAEYRAPEMTVTIGADTVTRLGDVQVVVPVRASYLFGPPVVGAQVTWSSRVEVTRAPLPQDLRDRGWSIGTPEYYWQYSVPNSGSTTTGADGVARVEIAVQPSALAGHGALHLSAAVTDANNQVVTATTAVPLPAPAFYIAARHTATAGRWRVGARQTLDVLTLGLDGTRLAGTEVRMAAVRQECVTNRDPRAQPGSRICTADTVSRARLTAGTTPVTFEFTPQTAGRFDIVFEATNDRGNNSRTILPWNWADNVGPRREPPLPPPPVPPFVLLGDSVIHSPGDTAIVRFVSPFPVADAWITREREGVFEQRRLTVRGDTTTLRIPITERDAPSIWIGVALIHRQPGLSAGLDTVDLHTRHARLQLVVDSAVKRLHVDVETRDTVHAPGDSATIRLRVRDVRAGRPGPGVRSEVAVWAVDDGVLSLTGFQTPAIRQLIYGRPELGALHRTVFAPRSWRVFPPRGAMGNAAAAFLVMAGGAGGGGGAGDGGEDGPEQVTTPRTDFRATAFFLGAVVTDDSGFAEVRAKLPDNTTTYRVMAVAVTQGDRYGSGETRLLATRDLVARLALPRFVRPGDSLTARAMVNARAPVADRVAVRPSIDGAALPADSARVVDIAPGATGVARFAVSVPSPPAASTTRVALSATGRVGSDAIETVLPIRSDATSRAHTIAGVLTGRTTVRFTLPTNIDPDRSRLSISLATSPLAAIRSDYERLRDYPYRHSEQIASAGNALLALHRASRGLRVELEGLDSVTVRADLQRAADELSRREDGGWIHFWPPPHLHLHTSVWVTAHAGGFLLDAQRAGVAVRPSLLTAIRARLGQVARDSIPDLRPDTVTGSLAERRARFRAWLGMRVVAARFIREAGAPDRSAEIALDRLAPAMAWEDRLVLIDLLAAGNPTATEPRARLDSAWRAVTVLGNRIDVPDSVRGSGGFPSHIRPAARLLSLTLRLEPTHPLIGALVATVTQQGRAEQRWAWNTQDYSAAAIALADFAVAQRGQGSRRVVVRSSRGSTLLTRVAEVASSDSSVPLSGLVARSNDSTVLTLELSGDGVSATAPIYYALTVDEIPLARPVTPDITGLVVERWFESFETGHPVSEVSEGDLVRVRLRVTVPSDRQFVALEDLLPAGLEAVDLTLRTSSTLSPLATTEFARSPAGTSMRQSGPLWQSLLYGRWDSGWWSPWDHTEIHDDRVSWFARQLWTGAYTATYVARATTPGRFVLPPAHAEEMFNRAAQGRTSGGVFVIRETPPTR